MAVPAFLLRMAAAWRRLSSAARVRILLASLLAVSLALRDVLLLATSVALLLVHEVAGAPRPRPAAT